MVGAARTLSAAVAAAVAASLATPGLAQSLSARGTCRDGAPQGIYELRAPDGRLRVLGAFNHGRRTGSFLFWSEAGVRVAQIPFDEDSINGTVALWYPESRGAEPRQRVEAVYVANRLNGEKRSWQFDGRLRARVRYAQGALVSAEAWDERGNLLAPDAALRLAQEDRERDDVYFATLDALVKAHPPNCESAPVPVPGQQADDSGPRLPPA